MTTLSPSHAGHGGETFRHEALLYVGEQEFLAGTVPFIRAGMACAEPVMVVVSRRKIELLRSALGQDADRLRFADMDEIGGNPARIIPVWREFVDRHGDDSSHCWGIGEPVWPGRRAPELDECVRHEALVNLAFDGSPGWSLLCPYDTATLDADVVEAVRRTHPVLRRGPDRRRSRSYDPAGATDLADGYLPEPTGPSEEMVFDAGPLRGLRRFVADHAARAGVGRKAAEDLVLAVNEVVTNSLRYGGGRGLLRVWRDADGLVCEVCDLGHVSDPLVGRARPPADRDGGRGLWMVNQLCDLVQLRSAARGTVVRLHTWVR